MTQDLTKHIFKALAHTGQRAIIGKGWAKLGTIKDEPTPPHVLLVDSVPHDWLFPRCSAVIHHGLPHESCSGSCSTELFKRWRSASVTLACILAFGCGYSS